MIQWILLLMHLLTGVGFVWLKGRESLPTLYKDKDKIQGLPVCSQYFLHADEKLKEHGFIYASCQDTLNPKGIVKSHK